MGGRIRPVIILSILILAFALRLRGIGNPLLDNQAWRQADTASIALNMMGHLTDFPGVFFPHLMYDGPVPQKVELEFPILPYILAWTWRLFGWADYWGRLWSIFFSLAAIVGLYELARRILPERAALMSAALYAVIPLAVYYGRTVMPESAAQALSLWALALIRRWNTRGQKKAPVGPALMLAGAVLAKLPQLMLLPVALILGFWPLQRKNIRHLAVYLLALLIPMLYYLWVHLGSPGTGRFVSGIVSQQVAGDPIHYSTLVKHLKQGMNSITLDLAAAGGALLLGRRARARLTLWVWLGVAVVYVSVVCIRIPLDYYLVPVLPLICLLAASALDYLADTPGNVLAVVVIGLVCFSSYTVLSPYYHWDKVYLEQGAWLREHLKPGQYLLLSDPQPMTFYYARAPGFRLSSAQPAQADEEIAKSGASYFVVLPGTDQSPALLKKISLEYPEAAPGIYRLR